MNRWTEAISRDDIVAMASDLIAIPSVTGDERAIMDFVETWARARGLDVQVVSKDSQRPNLVISTGDASLGPTIAMNGHLDVVPVSDAGAWRTDPFTPVVSDDGVRLFGRGSSDMKSSTGVMLYLLDLLKNAPLKGRLQAHIVSDEETSAQYGTIHVLEEIKAGRVPKPDFVFIGEKSDLKVRNAERGIFGMNITFHGRASHTAAARSTGVNAIAKAAKGVLALEEDIDSFHPAVGKPVISINTIHAGVAHNVVPGECMITVDRRTIPGETRASVMAGINAKFEAIAAADPLFKYTIDEDPHGDYIDANITDEHSPLVQAMQAGVRSVTGKEPEYFVAWAGATDGRFYRQAGIDTVGYGPGGEAAHGANEAVYIADLVTQAKVYSETIGALLGLA